jgi:outer membrane protein OmpA-like peptidoglycan-associated protein
MESQEQLDRVIKNKAGQRSVYQQLMSKSADLLLGAPQAVPDVEGLLGDCQFVGFNGNYSFFTGKGTTRNMKTLTREIQKSFVSMGLIKNKIPLKTAKWDYHSMAKGLSNASMSMIPKKKKFDTNKVKAKIEQQIAVEPTTWAEEGTLFQIEINFAPNQSNFSAEQYADDFKKAMSIAETYGGSLIIIEGHSDPMGILRARQKGRSPIEIQQMEQVSKNLSLTRSQSVRKSYLAYCKKKGIVVDPSQFVAVGLGASSPKFNPPRTKEEWAANRRVVFRIKQVEAELNEFVPLD